MKLSQVIVLGEKEIGLLRAQAESYTSAIPKESLLAVLLPGSVARGDFYPGKLGGMTDLIVFKRPDANVTADELFGKNEDPDVPYHCVKRDGDWYQIWFSEMLEGETYRQLPESRKFAINESILL